MDMHDNKNAMTVEKSVVSLLFSKKTYKRCQKQLASKIYMYTVWDQFKCLF